MIDSVILTQVGGMNDYISPDLLSEESYPRAMNVTSRGGKVHTRPAFRLLGEMPSGKFQGLYSLFNELYAVIGGKTYVSKDAATWTEVAEVTFSSLARRTWGTVVNQDLMINDGMSPPGVVGPTMRRKLGAGELPGGTACAYGQSRIFFADKTRRGLMASDVFIPGDYASVYKFTEYAFLNESFSIRQPEWLGLIKGMQFIRNAESGTGLGQLVVFHENGACAYNVYLPRTSWLNEQLGQVVLRYDACGGHDFIQMVNNDIFFRTGLGLTTLKDHASQTESGPRTIPLTMAISNLLSRDRAWTLEYGSLCCNEQRTLFTHGMRVDDYGDYYFDSLISVDMASFYSGGEAAMTFDGFWTGPKITKVLTGTLGGALTTFVSSKGASNANLLWMLDSSEIYDKRDVPIRLRWYTKRMFFDSALLFKRFLNATIWLSDLRADCEVTLYFRGDSDLWQTASSGSFTVPYYTDGDEDTFPQSRAKVKIPVASDVEDPTSCRPVRVATSFQFCVEIRGRARVELIRFSADDPSGDDGEQILCDLTNEDIELSLSEGALALYDYDEEFLT